MNKTRTSRKNPTQADLSKARKKAIALIQSKRTMMLATCMDQTPWAAPVYYLYTDSDFYFFSSPDALHTHQALSGSASAAAIYADGDQLDQIEGVQMSGSVTSVKSRIEKLTVTARYLTKFPLAKTLLGDVDAAIDLSQKVHLYRFTPEKVYYMDNRSGFGQRLEIDL